LFKLDNLFKQVGRCKAKVSKQGVEVRSFYLNIKSQHAQNEKNYITMHRFSILDLVVVEVP
jgi:hypothetical protein